MFKNVIPFRLRSDRPLSLDLLRGRLTAHRFVPCGNSQMVSAGFVGPVPQAVAYDLVPEGAPLVVELQALGDRFAVVALCIESRLLPASVVKTALHERIRDVERTTGARVKGRLKKELKEEVTRALIPKAFTRQSVVRAIIALKSGWVFVDTSSPSKADAFVSAFVSALEFVPVRRLYPQTPPDTAMHGWLLSGDAPDGFTVDRECELRGAGNDTAAIRYTHLDLDSDEVREHLRSGRVVEQMALTFNSRLSFLVTRALVFKKIVIDQSVAARASEDAQTPLDKEGAAPDTGDADSAAIGFSADMLIAGVSFVQLLTAFVEALGGEDPEAVAAAERAGQGDGEAS